MDNGKTGYLLWGELHHILKDCDPGENLFCQNTGGNEMRECKKRERKKIEPLGNHRIN